MLLQGDPLVLGGTVKNQGGNWGMARINFDDDVETQDEFWELLKLLNGNRDEALGKLVRFFRIAQKAYGKERCIAREELESRGLGCMIESGWAVTWEGGFCAKGAIEHFAWYRQRVRSSSAGGKARAAAPRDEKGRLLPSTSRVQPEPTRNQPESSALAPAPALISGHAKFSAVAPDPGPNSNVHLNTTRGPVDNSAISVDNSTKSLEKPENLSTGPPAIPPEILAANGRLLAFRNRQAGHG